MSTNRFYNILVELMQQSPQELLAICRRDSIELDGEHDPYDIAFRIAWELAPNHRPEKELCPEALKPRVQQREEQAQIVLEKKRRIEQERAQRQRRWEVLDWLQTSGSLQSLQSDDDPPILEVLPLGQQLRENKRRKPNPKRLDPRDFQVGNTLRSRHLVICQCGRRVEFSRTTAAGCGICR